MDSEQLGYSNKTDDRRAHTGPGDRQGYGGDIIADPALVMERPGDQLWYMLIGKGNNGGDGLVAARQNAQLRWSNRRVSVYASFLMDRISEFFRFRHY